MDAADLIYLSCPPAPRKAYALTAAAAGKALFLEKPLGVDVAESEDLVDRLASFGVPVAVNFTQAAGSALTDVSKAARSGVLGDVLRGRYRRNLWGLAPRLAEGGRLA